MRHIINDLSLAESPLVSVIIPNYNHAKFLVARIESVLNQTYQNIEVIILDDKSNDNSVDIIRNYEGHEKVKAIILNQSNSGSPFKQWKNGLNIADGEWIWIAESDDYCDESFLKKLVNHVLGRSNIGLIYCDSRIVEDFEIRSGTFATIKNRAYGTMRWNMNYHKSGVDEIEDYILPYGTINNTSAVLFNRKILSESDPFDHDFRFIGDKYAFIKVLAKSDILYFHEALNFYRNPFTIKHHDKFVLFFKEQFFIFDWIGKNMKIDNNKYYHSLSLNLRHTIYRSWSREKFKIYVELFFLNPSLFIRVILFNVIAPLREKISNLIKRVSKY